MTTHTNPGELVGEAAAARIAALQEQLQRYRMEHENAPRPLPAGAEDPVAQALVTPSPRILTQVTAALKKLADGTYGRCVACQRPIPARRLDAQPHLLECVAYSPHAAAPAGSTSK